MNDELKKNRKADFIYRSSPTVSFSNSSFIIHHSSLTCPPLVDVLAIVGVVAVVIIIIVAFAPQIDVIQDDAEDFRADGLQFLAGAANHVARALAAVPDQNDAIDH